MGKDWHIKKYWKTAKVRIEPVRVRWGVRFFLELCLACAVVAFAFYKSPFAMLMIIPTFPFYYKYRRGVEINRRKDKLRSEFKEFLVVTSASLSAGYSMENAVRNAEKDLSVILPNNSEMIKALKVINRRVMLNEPIEKVLLEFGRNVGVEDIESFAEIFSFAKRSGGDYVGIMRKTSTVLQEKIDVSRDIQTIISQKKTEARIMDLVPIGIVLYLQVSSPSFLSGLYGSLTGVVIMTGCLIVYIAAILIGEKMVDLRV